MEIRCRVNSSRSKVAGLIMRVPAHREGDREQSEEIRQLCIRGGPYDKVPVVGHQRHRKDRQRNFLPRFIHRPHKRSIIIRLLKQSQPRNRPVQHMKHLTGWTNSFRSGHAQILAETRENEQKKELLNPFSVHCWKEENQRNWPSQPVCESCSQS